MFVCAFCKRASCTKTVELSEMPSGARVMWFKAQCRRTVLDGGPDPAREHGKGHVPLSSGFVPAHCNILTHSDGCFLRREQIFLLTYLRISAVFAYRRGRMCLPSARSERMHSLPRGRFKTAMRPFTKLLNCSKSLLQMYKSENATIYISSSSSLRTKYNPA